MTRFPFCPVLKRALVQFNCFLLLLIILHSLRATNVVDGKEPKTYNEILKTLKHPEKLILDITSATEDILSGKIQTLEESGIALTPLVFDLKGINKLKTKYNNNNGLNYDLFVKYPALILNQSMIRTAAFTQDVKIEGEFNEMAILNQEPSTNAVVFHANMLSSNITNTIKLKDAFISFKSHRTNVRIALLTDDLGQLVKLGAMTARVVDLVIAQIKLPVRYADFIGEFKEMLKETKREIQIVNPDIEVILYIPFRTFAETAINLWTEEEQRRYFYLIIQAAVAWINAGATEGIILEGFYHTNVGEADWFAKSEFKNMIGVEIGADSLQKYPSPVRRDKSWKPAELCRLQTLLDVVSVTFSNVVVSLDMMKAISTLSAQQKANQHWNSTCLSAASSATLVRLHLNVQITENDSEIDVFLKDYVHNTNIKYALALVVFNFTFIDNKPVKLPKVLEQLKEGLPRESKIGCLFGDGIENSNVKDLLTHINQKCRPLTLINQTTLTLVWDVELKTSDLNDAIEQLNIIRNSSIYILKEMQNGSIQYEIIIQNRQRDALKATADNEALGSLLCNSERIDSNVVAEAVVNFGRVHGLPIVTRNAFESFKYRYGGSWWKELDGYSSFDHPIFVARGYPDFYTVPNFVTVPCLPSPDVWKEKLHVPLHPEFSGTTLYVDRPMTAEELETLFVFTFNKFSLIEIIPTSYSDVILTLNVLSTSSALMKKSKGKQIYLQFDGNLLRKEKIGLVFLRELPKLKTKITGIHCINCIKESSLMVTINESLTFYQNMKADHFATKVGFVLKNCKHVKWQSFLPRSTQLQVFSLVDYLLCNGKKLQLSPIINRNAMELERYLDFHLFVKNLHQRYYEYNGKHNMDFLFRHNPTFNAFYYTATGFAKDKAISEEYLKFVAAASQYATAYQLKFFFSSAFDKKEDESRRGWWRISDFENLANVSTFIERESEYFKRETWRPKPYAEEDVSSSILSSVGFMVGISVGITALSFVILVLLPVLWYRRKFVFLSRAEVEFFLNGKNESSKNGLTQCTGDDDVENLKFPNEYEIPAVNFCLLNVLGQGNFGVVHKAQVQIDNNDYDGDNDNRTQFAAVKMPLPGCTKESFKSMLSELKVLCYVGRHTNVIQFIGAHVKEIGKGKVYIATEMCENGALINYLRNLHTESKSGNSQSEGLNEDLQTETSFGEDLITQLNRFSYEICLGMEYLGDKKIIHGDLSARNVLLDSTLSCKIGDFGLSRKLYEYQTYVKKSQEPLPWRWMALESLRKMEFTTKSDVWSYGVTIWEVYSLGGVPYPGLSWTINFVDELENGLRLTSPFKATAAIYEKMGDCWKPDPERRPTFSELASFFRAQRDKEYVDLVEA